MVSEGRSLTTWEVASLRGVSVEFVPTWYGQSYQCCCSAVVKMNLFPRIIKARESPSYPQDQHPHNEGDSGVGGTFAICKVDR
jgi:hypothetical protein